MWGKPELTWILSMVVFVLAVIALHGCDGDGAPTQGGGLHGTMLRLQECNQLPAAQQQACRDAI